MKVKSLSRVLLLTTLWTIAYQASQSIEFSKKEYWSGLTFPSPGDLPNPGIEPRSPTLQANTLPSEPAETQNRQYSNILFNINILINILEQDVWKRSYRLFDPLIQVNFKCPL